MLLSEVNLDRPITFSKASTLKLGDVDPPNILDTHLWVVGSLNERTTIKNFILSDFTDHSSLIKDPCGEIQDINVWQIGQGFVERIPHKGFAFVRFRRPGIESLVVCLYLNKFRSTLANQSVPGKTYWHDFGGGVSVYFVNFEAY